MIHAGAASEIFYGASVNPQAFALAPYWPGNDHGQFYTSLGRGGKGIIDPWVVQEPALLYTPKLPVQVLGLGTTIAGSYYSQPLAVPPSQNSSSL